MPLLSYKIPGVYFHDLSAPIESGIASGVPVLIGYSGSGKPSAVREISRWEQFAELFGTPKPDRYLAYAVRGFFANGGTRCFVCAMDRDEPVAVELDSALEKLAHDPATEDADLICAPDLLLFPGQETALQQKILDFCRVARGGERFLFAILDAMPAAGVEALQQQRGALRGDDGALYHPWLRVADGPAAVGGCVPPSGHLAGIYARSDSSVGIHKAPANEVVEEALDLAVAVTDKEQTLLNPDNINCLRAFPGRGIRVWGARTLSSDPAWRYVNVRRLMLAICRWIERKMASMLFEPNDSALWLRITRELGSYLGELHRKGAFRGATAEESFYVKCDGETNGQDRRDCGELVAEVGIAAALPGEFIVVRIVRSDNRVTVTPKETTVSADGPSSPPAGTAKVVILAVLENPPGADLPQEHILIGNRGETAVDMTGWVLKDRAGHRFEFPGLLFHPGTEMRIWTKSGENSVTDLYWGHRAPLWNNTGDTAYLYDARENEIASFEYVRKIKESVTT